MSSQRSTPVNMDRVYSIDAPVHYVHVSYGKAGVYTVGVGEGGIGNVSSLLKAKTGSY